MIDGIRRRFAKSFDRELWDADRELEPEIEDSSELPTDAAVLLAAATVTAEPASNDVNTKEYYKSLIRTAIEQGGNYRGQQMSVPWLRMILAGLESKRIAPEMMWEGEEASGTQQGPLPEIPSYEDLFSSERDAPTGPDPR